MWPFRRKSVDGQLQATDASPQRHDGRRRESFPDISAQQGLPTSEITAEVYYLGAMQVSDSKSIPTMVATIGEMKGKGRMSGLGKNARLVEFCLKRDYLTLYDTSSSAARQPDAVKNGGRKPSRLRSASKQKSDMLDDSMEHGSPSRLSNLSGEQSAERAPIFRAHASTIAMCLQESLYGNKPASTGTEHFALNMTELAPIRMTSGQVVQRRIHWCHVFRAKNHAEAYRLVQCIAYTFMELGQKAMVRHGNASATVERHESSIFSRHDNDTNAVMSVSSSSPSPPRGRRRSLNEVDSGRGTDTSHHNSQGALHLSHGSGAFSRQSNSSIHSALSGSLSAVNGHHGGRPLSAGPAASHISGSLGTVLERHQEVTRVTPESRHRNTLSMASSIGSEASGGSQAYSSPGNTLPQHSQAALAVEAELQESSGIHASDLSVETSQLVLSNALLRNNCRLKSSSATDDDYQAALHAIGSDDNDKLELLLEKTIPANGEDGNNHNLMHYAAALENAGAVTILTKCGCRMDTRDALGWTPLHRSAVRGCRDVLRLLLKHNAEITAVDNWGSTALHHCVNARQSRYLECTYALVEHGAPIAQQNRAKIKPSDYLPELKEMQKRLVSSLSGALSKLPSLAKTMDEDTPVETNLVPSPEVSTIADILEASDDRHSSNLGSPHAPFAPPTTPLNELEDGQPFSAEVKAMAALVGDHPIDDSTSWDAQTRLKQESLKQLDETYREVSTGSQQSGPIHLPLPGAGPGDLPPLHIPRSNSSVIKEQLEMLVDREMEQLSTRASSLGDRDMPSRPMSRRVSSSKTGAAADVSKDGSSPANKVKVAAAAMAAVLAASKESDLSLSSPITSSGEHSQPGPATVLTIPKRVARKSSADQLTTSSASPDKAAGVLEDRRATESDSSAVLHRTRSALAHKPSKPVVVRHSSDKSIASPHNTPPKSLSSSGDLTQMKFPSRQNHTGMERVELRPSPLQRHKHSMSQPTLLGTSAGTTSSGGTQASQEFLRDAVDQEEEEPSEEQNAASAILHLLYMLSRNPECHSELLAHLALPSNADRLVAMAHAPGTGVEDLSKIAHLLQNMFEADGARSRSAAISAGMLNIVVSMCNTPRALQLPCLNLLEDLLGAPTERRYGTQLSSVNCLPLLDLLLPLDNDSGIDPRRHATPPLHMRRSSYLADYEYDGRSSSFSIVSDYSMFIRHSALKVLSMASYFEKMQKNLNHRRALLLLKERALEDPSHLMSLTLEILANVALQYDVHPTLEEHGIPDAIRQFLSTSSSGRQRYHATRMLVYMGHRNVRHRYLFDPKIVNILASNDIITMTSDRTSPVRALTIERLVELVTSSNSAKLWGEAVLVNPKVSTTTATNPANSATNAAVYSLDVGDDSPPLARRLTDAEPAVSVKGMSPGRIIDFVLCIYRTMVHPIIFLRLLIHRMQEPRTFSMFDWDNERFEDYGDISGGAWSINANSRLRPEHMYSMRVLEIWLDSYPAVFQEFPSMIDDLKLLLEPLKRVGGPYMEFYNRLKQLLSDARRPKDLPDGMVPRHREMPVHNELYAQCQNMIVGGDQPCSEEDAIFLAALQIHIENIAGVASARSRFNKFKRREKSSLTIKTKRCLVAELSRNKSVQKKVKSVYQQIADRGLSERNSKHYYIRLCYSMDSSGCVFYKVKEKMLGKNKSIRRYLGVSPHCVVILDEKTKGLQATHHFTEIRKWTPLPEKMSIMFEFENVTTIFQLESMSGLSELRRNLDHCIEELDWQKVHHLDNSPWSLLAEREGIWGLEAVCSLARTRAVREMFMIQMDGRNQQEEEQEEVVEDEDTIGPTGEEALVEGDLQHWDDDEQDLPSDTDEDHDALDDELADPMRALRELTQTLQEEEFFESRGTSTLSMSATKQEMDLSQGVNAAFSSAGVPPALSQSFTAGAQQPSFLESPSKPSIAKRIVSRRQQPQQQLVGDTLDTSPSADTFLGSSDHSDFDNAWTSAPRFTDPTRKDLVKSRQSRGMRTHELDAAMGRQDSPLAKRPASAKGDVSGKPSRGPVSHATSASVGDLTRQNPLASLSTMTAKHSHPVSADSLSESLQALAAPSQPCSRPASRPRSRTFASVADERHSDEGVLSPGRSSLHRPSHQTPEPAEAGRSRGGRVRAHTESEVLLTPSALVRARQADRRAAGMPPLPPQSAVGNQVNISRLNPLSNSPHFMRNPLFSNSPGPHHHHSLSTGLNTQASNSPATLQRQRAAIESGYTPQRHSGGGRGSQAPLSPSLWGSDTLNRFQMMPGNLGGGGTSSLGCSPNLLRSVSNSSPNMKSSSGTVNQLGIAVDRFASAGVQMAAQRVAARQKCKCSPDPALVPGFSLLEITSTALLEIPKELARQMTLIDHGFFCKITLPDFLHKLQPSRSFQVSSKDALQAGVAVGHCAQHLGRIASFVAVSILQEPTREARAEIIRQFIITSKYLHQLRNFSGMLSILVAGLGSSPIRRLSKTWELVSKEDMDIYHQMEQLLSPKGNYKMYREGVAAAATPAVPFIGLCMKDLTFLSDGNPDYVAGGIMNLQKRKQFYSIYYQMRCFQQHHYNYTALPMIQDFLLNQPNIDDEVLHQISRRVEPPTARGVSQLSLNSTR